MAGPWTLATLRMRRQRSDPGGSKVWRPRAADRRGREKFERAEIGGKKPLGVGEVKGRKPDSDHVVPLTDGNVVTFEGSESPEDRERCFQRMAQELAAELRPRKMDPETRKVWDRLAPQFMHPTVDRVKPHMVEAFALMCQVRARYERLRAEVAEVGETYESETRNGFQIKSRPEVGQMNEAFRQFLTLLRDFGGTAASDRGVRAPGQRDMFDDPSGVGFA